MERTWTEVGEELIGIELEGRVIATRDLIESAIAHLDWTPAEGTTTLAAIPGLAIKHAIAELSIPKVSQFAISSELAPYGLYGIEGNYKNGRARVYICDFGSKLTPLASDFFGGIDT